MSKFFFYHIDFSFQRPTPNQRELELGLCLLGSETALCCLSYVTEAFCFFWEGSNLSPEKEESKGELNVHSGKNYCLHIIWNEKKQFQRNTDVVNTSMQCPFKALSCVTDIFVSEKYYSGF